MDYIMLIGDSPEIRMRIEMLVSCEDYHVRQAENGLDALLMIDEIQRNGDDVSLCLTDINMPNMHGISFIEEFRKKNRFAPILVLTPGSANSGIDAVKKNIAHRDG